MIGKDHLFRGTMKAVVLVGGLDVLWNVFQRLSSDRIVPSLERYSGMYCLVG